MVAFTEARLTTRSSAGPALYTYHAIPEKPVGLVALLHGYADYGGRYAHVAEAWNARGLGVVAIDLRGHGHSEGARGHVQKWEEYLDDVGELVKLLDAVEAKTGPLPRFLFGHSNGGLIAGRTVEVTPHRWNGLITSSAFFRLALPVPAPKLFAGRIASKILPKLALPSGIPGGSLTHDTAIAARYESDPLVFKTATARWFVETEAAQRKAIDEARTVKIPALIAHGEADPVASPSGSRDFFAGLSSADKTFLNKPGELHEIMNELGWKTTATEMADWMLERL